MGGGVYIHSHHLTGGGQAETMASYCLGVGNVALPPEMPLKQKSHANGQITPSKQFHTAMWSDNSFHNHNSLRRVSV